MAFVKSCPTTKDTYLEASRRLGCLNDTYHHNQYMCLPNAEKTSLVEFCNNAIMGIQEKGSCLEASVGKLIRHSCKNFSLGCPENAFWEYEYYKYPACQYINTKQQCYVMDPSCPTDAYTEETKNHETIIFACSVIGGLLVVLIIAAVIFIRNHKRTQGSNKHEATGLLIRSISDTDVNSPGDGVSVMRRKGNLQRPRSLTDVHFASEGVPVERCKEMSTTLSSLKATKGQHHMRKFITAKIVKVENPVKYNHKTMLKATIADKETSATCIVYDPDMFSLFQQDHCIILHGIIKRTDGVLIITRWSQVFAAAKNAVDGNDVQSSDSPSSTDKSAVQLHSSEEDPPKKENNFVGEICGIPNNIYRHGNYKKYTKKRINLMTCTNDDVVIELLIKNSKNDMQIFTATKYAIEQLFKSMRRTAELPNAENFLQTFKDYLPLTVNYTLERYRIVSLQAV